MTWKRSDGNRSGWLRKILVLWFRYFVQGLVLLAPLGISIAVVVWLVQTLDGLVRNWLPPEIYFPGIGVILVVGVITLVGMLSRFLLVHGVFTMVEQAIERIPGVNVIYRTMKELIHTLQKKPSHLGTPVMVRMDEQGTLWKPGLIVREDTDLDSGRKMYLVYLPHSYNFSGNVFYVDKSRLLVLEKISSAEFMKYIASAGLLEPSSSSSSSSPPSSSRNREPDKIPAC